ncbi:hypothetical protein BGZ76_000564 [Entomortierella beljakovae]|nr:hypothetical protein BGZ76_000564 [Entomortierella beljakovae]
MNEPISSFQLTAPNRAILSDEAAIMNTKERDIDISSLGGIQSSVKVSTDGADSIGDFDLPKEIQTISSQIMRSASIRQKNHANQQDYGPRLHEQPQIQPQERKQEPLHLSSPRQHIQYSHSYHHHHHHHHHHHQYHNVHNGSNDIQSDKKQKRNRRFSYSKVGTIPSQEQQKDQIVSQEQQCNHQQQYSKDKENQVVTGSCSTHNGIHGDLNNNNNGSWAHLVDPALKCCNIRTPNPPLKVLTTCSNSLSRGDVPWEKPSLKKGTVFEETSPSMTHASPSAQAITPSDISTSGTDEQEFLQHDPITRTHPHEQFDRPRVCKMLLKHPVVKLIWRVPEPIKAGGETLRGVLIISTKEHLESEIKASVSKMSRKKSSNKNVFIEHIEIDLTGVEEVTSGAGLLSRTKTDHHCFLHKTQVLPVEELKWINNSSSSSGSGSVVSPTNFSTPIDALPLARMPTSTSTSTSTASTVSSHITAMPEYFQPGLIPLGARQGIPFQMRVPERVGGTFKSAHASISYHLTANVHIRYGNEVFVLQHPIPLCLFELVQIRAATKVASPHDLMPKCPNDNRIRTRSSSISNSSPTSPSEGISPTSSVRFVIPRSSSVLGTASVKPYSLWGLGPATSSQRHHYSYGNHHGYGRYRQGSHNNQRNPTMHSTVSSTSLLSANGMGQAVGGMPRSQSASGALGSQQFYDEMNSVATDSHSSEDQYRNNGQQKLSRGGRHNSHRDSGDGLDEVGFGAHIDKSVAAAGDSVTLDMFVVKSDLMRVVDIKVSLVETTQIFSLLDHNDLCNVISPIASRARIFEMGGVAGTVGGGVDSSQQSRSRRKLVDTHVVKIAKNYVPAQSEENHANGNHLKGYYEDFEDFRTAKSLSMYKLGMRIPENALTILDRELLQVEYMFVIKFFFKGRMGAFLEVPIEIISQYNHNRISTISGAISCVSNSVQIALPPVPILTKRIENPSQPDVDEVTDSYSLSEVDCTAEINGEETQGEDIATLDSFESTSGGANEEGEDEDSDRYSNESASMDLELSDVATTEDASEQISLNSNSTVPKNSTQDITKKVPSKNTKKPKVISAQQSVLSRTEVTEQTKAANAAIKEREKEKERILAASRLSRKESDAGKSNVARLTAVLMSNMDTVGSPTKELTRTRSNASTKSSTLKSRALAFEGEGIPKIMTDTTCTGGRRSTTVSPSSTVDQKLALFTESPSTITPTSATRIVSSASGKITAASPALPYLFDLTSAALQSPSHPSVPSPNLSAKSSSSRSSHSSESSSSSVKTFGIKGHEAPQQYQPSYLRHNASSSNGGSSCSREEDSFSSSSSTHTHNNGFVAKIARSLSSTPLLRSRAFSHGGVSPSGSSTNLVSVSSNQQPSLAFTLAATTLSALTLLPSVGQSASNNNNGGNQHMNRRASHQVISTSSQPLKSCLKSRRLSEPLMMGISVPAVDINALKGSPSPLPTPQQFQQFQFQQQQLGGIRKKVTFAKGTTPQSSPTASQIFLQEVEQYTQGRMNQQYLQSPFPSGNIGVNFTAESAQANGIFANAATANTAAYMSTPHPHSTPFPGQFQNMNNGAGMSFSGPSMVGTTSAAVAAGAVARSPNSASPRSRLHHPFDRHPSRLSPLEMQKLDFRIRGGQAGSRGTVNINGASGGVGAGQQQQQQQQQRQHDEDDECDYEEDEELEYDEEDEEEDDEDDRESEEERIERRRQARVAWLAKYGDAFKQVYGAVPELPPI